MRRRLPREVMADPGLIEQILQNLYLNAADAMPCGGDLFLDVKNLQGDRDGQGRDPAESYVLLTVRDTGSGMDAQTAKHIFEPFFTTKGSRGKGLGLASVLQHGQGPPGPYRGGLDAWKRDHIQDLSACQGNTGKALLKSSTPNLPVGRVLHRCRGGAAGFRFGGISSA